MAQPYYEDINRFIKHIIGNIEITYEKESLNLKVKYIQQKLPVVEDGLCVAIKDYPSHIRCSRKARKGSDVCGLHARNPHKFRKITDNTETIFSAVYTFTIYSTNPQNSSYIEDNHNTSKTDTVLYPFKWNHYKCLIDYASGKLYYKLSNGDLFLISNLHYNKPKFYLHAEMI